MFENLFKRNTYTLEEFWKIGNDYSKVSNVTKLFKTSPEYNSDLQIIEKIGNYEFPNAYDYISVKNEFTALNVYHFAMVLQYIFLGYKEPLKTDNANTIVTNNLSYIGKVESDNSRKYSKDLYYGAVFSGLFDYCNLVKKTNNINEYSNEIVKDLAWFYFSVDNLSWFQEYIKIPGKFLVNKETLETSLGSRLDLSNETFLGIKQRYQLVLQRKIENVSVVFQGFN